MITCTCRPCSQLKEFCQSPNERVTRFNVAKDLRRHLHKTIEDLSLDLNHKSLRNGSPYTLVCTKNRESYLRRISEYAEDVRCMDLLVKLVPMDDAGHPETERVRRLMVAREAFRSQ